MPGCSTGACWHRARCRRGANRPDRKSTRLNSSHANISYAVFCLKKKNGEHMNLDVDLAAQHQEKRERGVGVVGWIREGDGIVNLQLGASQHDDVRVVVRAAAREN